MCILSKVTRLTRRHFIAPGIVDFLFSKAVPNEEHISTCVPQCYDVEKIFIFFILDTSRVRCTINRSHSTPCKKAEFEHLQIFPGHCLDYFLSVSGKICHSPIKKVKRQPTFIISFSQHSPFFWEQSKNPG